MKPWMTAAVLLALASPALAQDGRAEWKRCSACHAVPDPGLAPDRDWIARLDTTS